MLGLMATFMTGGFAQAQGFGSATTVFAALHNCQDETVAPGARVDACTAVIHANLMTHPLLANMYLHRALAYEAEGDIDHAIQDCDKALELKPDYEAAKENRDRLAASRQQERPDSAEPSGGSQQGR